MTREFYVFYIEASLVSIVVYAMLLYHDFRTFNRSERQVQFDHTLIAFMLYFISDGFWAGVSSGQIRRTQLTVALPNLSNVVIIALVSYQWLRFAAASLCMPRRNERWVQTVMRLPLEVVSTVLIVAWIIAPDFWISPEGEMNNLYYILLLLAPLIYVLDTLGYCLYAAAKQKNGTVRRRYVLIGLCPLIVALLGVLQIIMLNSPVFCLGCLLLMLYFFLKEAEDQISIDPLTGLNNRGQLLRYVAQEEGGRHDGSTFVMMIDANNFKNINDTFGHAEGDRALMLIAETLKENVADIAPPPFLGRYGGDEFILVVHTADASLIADISDRIRRGLQERSEKHALPYDLSVSIGAAQMTVPRDSFQSCLEQADRRLYQDKARGWRRPRAL